MATDANNGQANNPGDGSGAEQKPKVEFTDEQQKAIDSFINKAVGRATAPLKEELNAKAATLSQLQADLQSAKDALAAAKSRGESGKEEKADVEELKRQLDEFKRIGESSKTAIEQAKQEAAQHRKEAEQAKLELLNTRKQVTITSEAVKHNFINTEQVLKLTSDNIKWDDAQQRFIVYGEDGRERYNSQYEPMTVGEFLAEFAQNNKHLVRGDVRPGAGSSESARSGLNGQRYELKQIFGKESNSALASKLMKEDPKMYRAMKEQARAQGLIA